MNQYFYVCSRCKTRIYINDLKHILIEDIKRQISIINYNDMKIYTDCQIIKIKNEIKTIDVKNQKAFEQYANNRITEQNFKATIDDLTIRKNVLKKELVIGKSNKLIKKLLELSNKDITDKLIINLIGLVVTKNIDKTKHSVHINYNFED